MRICTKSKDGRHNFIVPDSDCWNKCGVNQYVLSHGKPKEEESPFNNYIDKFIRNFIAYKIAEHEDEFCRKEPK